MIVQSTPISSISPEAVPDLLGVALEVGQARSRVAQDQRELLVAVAGESLEGIEAFLRAPRVS